jgi:hypothetical protein
MMHFKCFAVAGLVTWMSVTGWSAEVDVAEPAAESSAVADTPVTSPQSTSLDSSTSLSESGKTILEIAEVEPWDYSPYRVLIWLVSDDPSVNADSMKAELRAFLDRDYFSVWRFNLADAPAAIRSAAVRDIGGLSYDSITAADPVLAVKRDHPEAVRIRIAKNVGEFVGKVYGTKGRIEEVKRRAAAVGDATIDGVVNRLEAVEGDAGEVQDLWVKDETEAVLVSRGMAITLTEPAAKLMTPRISNLVSDAVDRYDKIFIVRVKRDVIPHQVDAVEFDSLMRHFGPVASVQAATERSLPHAVGRAISKAFAPVVRIENAGQSTAVGLLRAGGLIVDDSSPANIRIDDVLEPMTRKNDRNGKPILIGPLDWSFLLVSEPEIAVLRGAKGIGLKTGDQLVSVLHVVIRRRVIAHNDLPQPLHATGTNVTWHHGAHRKPVVRRQRHAVHLQRDKRTRHVLRIEKRLGNGNRTTKRNRVAPFGDLI